MINDNQMEIIRKINGLAFLKENWDGYGGLMISSELIEKSREFIEALPDSPAFDVVPLSRGGIQFEFMGKNRSIELSIENISDIDYLQWDAIAEDGEEGQCGIDDYEKINSVIAWVYGG